MNVMEELTNKALKALSENNLGVVATTLGYIKIHALRKQINLNFDKCELMLSEGPMGHTIHINNEEGCQVRVNCKEIHLNLGEEP